jgi:hypothetical protein
MRAFAKKTPEADMFHTASKSLSKPVKKLSKSLKIKEHHSFCSEVPPSEQLPKVFQIL